MEQLTLVLDNIRSAHNVGSIFRSAAAFGVKDIISLGITPFPEVENDRRLPHVAQGAHRQIAKTALGAERLVQVRHYDSCKSFLDEWNYPLLVLEQASESTALDRFEPELPAALVLGNEVEGVAEELLARADSIIEIPHSKDKESLNVSSAAAVALYDLSVKLRR